MRTPRLIGPPIGTTPAGLRALPGQRRALPDDLLREASKRLGAMALVAAALWVVGAAGFHLAMRAMPDMGRAWNAYCPTDGVALACVALSLVLFFYARRRDRDPQFVLDLGLLYMILMSLALGLLVHLEHGPPGAPVTPMISWIGAIVLMTAAIVPNTPGKTLAAGLIAASMNPLAMLVARAQGRWDFGPASNVLVMHYPDYLLVGVAVVISHVVNKLGERVTKAREMGSYQLGELLGRGGMGAVYTATHRMLARPAAIKLIRPEALASADTAATQTAIRRFRREAEVAASLRSPHTVELYDFGVTEDGTFYLVMELLEGMDAESLVSGTGPVPAGRAIYILRQVCESLAEAHAAGLVHRDIKPANIHVGRLGLQQDFVKVLDFGLVKPMASDDTDTTLATAAGLTAGTPAYMAPEMALGEAIDGRADLYALGCVAYWLLCGQRVFEAANGVQVIAKHLREEPVPPSQRADVQVPAALERLVLACLAKQPAERPQSAAELSRALAAIETAPWGEDQAESWWKRHATPSTASLEHGHQ